MEERRRVNRASDRPVLNSSMGKLFDRLFACGTSPKSQAARLKPTASRTPIQHIQHPRPRTLCFNICPDCLPGMSFLLTTPFESQGKSNQEARVKARWTTAINPPFNPHYIACQLSSYPITQSIAEAFMPTQTTDSVNSDEIDRWMFDLSEVNLS